MNIQLTKQLSEKYLIETVFQKCNMSNVSQYGTVGNIDSDIIQISNTGSKYVFTLNESNNSISVEFKWLTSSKNICPVTKAITECIVGHFGGAIYGKQLYGFTELKKGVHLYQSDVNYRNQGYWNDNVLIAWESSKRLKQAPENLTNCDTHKNDNTAQVLCELMSMFQIENKDTLYCVIHSCHFQSNKTLVLSSMWMKEYYDVPVSRFNEYKTLQLTSPLEGEKPLYCIVEADSIVKHCLLIPYHAPSSFFLLIKDPIEWSKEFHSIP